METRKYTPSHEWVQINDDIARVGISLHAKKELGEIVYVQLPEVGMKISAGEEVAVLESTKAAADIYAPISGTITEVNIELQDNLNWINEDPESKGWLFKMTVSISEEEDSLLLNPDQYSEMIHE